MEADIFSLFEQKHLELVLRNQNEQKPLLKDFARFLSAYFANFPLICSKNRQHLPSLFTIYNFDKKNFYEISRRQVSINLPITYTPTLATHLLIKCDLFLEAVLFVDHFNDVRSALIMRHFVDLNFGFVNLIKICNNDLG